MTTDGNDDRGRWASEGGADPRGPATASPADPRPSRAGAAHPGQASDVPASPAGPDETKDPPVGQEEEPAKGSSLFTGEPAPQDIGESG